MTVLVVPQVDSPETTTIDPTPKRRITPVVTLLLLVAMITSIMSAVTPPAPGDDTSSVMAAATSVVAAQEAEAGTRVQLYSRTYKVTANLPYFTKSNRGQIVASGTTRVTRSVGLAPAYHTECVLEIQTAGASWTRVDRNRSMLTNLRGSSTWMFGVTAGRYRTLCRWVETQNVIGSEQVMKKFGKWIASSAVSFDSLGRVVKFGGYGGGGGWGNGTSSGTSGNRTAGGGAWGGGGWTRVGGGGW